MRLTYGQVLTALEFRLSLRCQSDLRSSGMLHSVGWPLLTDISGIPVGSTCKRQSTHEACSTMQQLDMSSVQMDVTSHKNRMSKN